MSDKPEKPLIHRGCFVCGEALVSDGHIRDCVKKLKLRCRGFQVMAREFVNGIEQYSWMAAIEEGKYERAGGDVECHTCHLLYFEHPELPKWPTFHMLCNGEIVKT